MGNHGGDQGDAQPKIPIRNRGQLPWPRIRQPHECAQALYVDSFLPHARVRIFANTTELIGDQRPWVGYELNFPLSRPLKSTDMLTATQEYQGVVSDPTNPPVTVLPQSKPLDRPAVDDRVYACGQVALVTNLNPSTHVEVYSAATTPVPIDPAHLIGTGECTGDSLAVVTQPLKQGWHVVARQLSCPGTNHEVISDVSHSATVQADLSPMTPPTLDKPIVGNDVVQLHKLYVGAAVKVTDSTAVGAPSLAGGLANADDDWAPLHPAAHAVPPGPEYHAWQDLCTSSGPGPGVGTTTDVATPVLVSPICPKSATITVRRATLNAILGLFKEGDPSPLIFFGAAPGEFEVDLPTYSPAVGDHLYIKCVAPFTSPESNHVRVGDCRNVITQHNDNSRTGAYLHEQTLTPANVHADFRRLAEREVDGSPFAQILYVRAVRTPIGLKNIAIVATSTNMVYAFDADDHSPAPAAGIAWKVGPLGPTRSLTEAEICRETHGPVGITSTPVIDVGTQTIYAVARHWNSTTPSQPGHADLSGDNYLHALKLTDGTPRYQAVKIEGTDPRTGMTFDPTVERNRPGLLLLNGIVYIGFGVFNCDQGEYRGWVFGYTAEELRPAAIFCTTKDEPHAAGIWQSGNGLVGADEGVIYFETGNDIGGQKVAPLGDAFVRLEVTPGWPGLQLAGHFQPSNAEVLQTGDTDLGAGGPMLLPRGHLIGGGKQGRYYVLDANTLHLAQDAGSPDAAVVGQGFQAFVNQYDHFYANVAAAAADDYRQYARGEVYGPNIHAGPCFWRGPGLIYKMPEKDDLKAFQYDEVSGHVQTSPALIATGTHQRPPDGMPGGFSSLSANGDREGIIWTSLPNAALQPSDGQWFPVHGVLAAFDASTLKELWSDTFPEWFAKFNPPTIADGKVFRPVFAQYALAGGRHIFEHHNPAQPLDDDGSAPLELAPGKVIIYGLRHPAGGKPEPGHWPLRQWRHWEGGGDPPPRLTLQEKRDRHIGSGPLVAVTSDEQSLPDGGQRQDFKGWVVFKGTTAPQPPDADPASCHHPPRTRIPLEASIFWSEPTGAHIVLGQIRDEYLRHDGPAGRLGYPTSDELPGHEYPQRVSNFEHGTITWDPSNGLQVEYSAS